jgi:hypothetical protein
MLNIIVDYSLLAWQDSFRTFNWSKALPIPELILGQARQLLALI